MADTYTRVNWKDSPSTQTPISAENLNKMDKGIEDAHNKLGELSEQIANKGNPTDEQVSSAVNEYLAENPIESYIDYDMIVKSINHRGYNRVAPENTIPAFILSRQNGFKYVEADVRFTSDGVAVMLHDETINKYVTSLETDVYIKNITYTEVAQYDWGSWKSSDYTGTKIATFEEFIKLCKYIGLHPYIELKAGTESQIQSLVDTVQAHGMSGKVTWISFSATNLGYIKAYDSKARLGFLAYPLSESTATDIITTVQGLQTEENEVFVDSELTALSDEGVQCLINANIPLEGYDTTTYAESRILAMNSYITGVTTDQEHAGKILYEANMIYTAPEINKPEDSEATLTSISASYTGGSVAVGTTVASLTGITVTGTYSDGSVVNITDYTLNGTIAEGSNTITVSYSGLTTTFTVTGITESGGDEPDEPTTDTLVYNWDFTQSLTDSISGVTATLNGGATQDSDGVHLNSASDFVNLDTSNAFFTCGRTVEFDIGDSNANLSGSHGRLFCFPDTQVNITSGGTGSGVIYRNTGVWNSYISGWGTDSIVTDSNALANKTVSLKKVDDGYNTAHIDVYLDGVLIHTTLSKGLIHDTGYPYVYIGASSQAFHDITIKACRVYEAT